MVIPPPPGAPPPPGQRVAGQRDYLSVPLGSVFTAQPGHPPLTSFTPARGQTPSGKVMLQGRDPQHGAQAVTVREMEQLLSALGSLRNANDEAETFANSLSVRQFRQLNPAGRLAHINGIWDRCTTWHTFTEPTGAMLEPAHGNLAGNGPLPTSVCPDGNGGFHKRLPVGAQPFRDLGIGFRTEGSTERALRDGFTQQRLNVGFMRGPHRGLALQGTVMDNAGLARVWTGNHDIFNESAVCVSRNFFGGTAFPLRETNALCYLFAVDCSGQQGLDTEGYQVNLPGARQWRPGEKAYGRIPPDRILGFVPVQRRGAPAGGGWRFEIDQAANWTITGTPTVRQRTYLIDELEAWRGSHVIPPEFDFAN